MLTGHTFSHFFFLSMQSTTTTKESILLQVIKRNRFTASRKATKMRFVLGTVAAVAAAAVAIGGVDAFSVPLSRSISSTSSSSTQLYLSNNIVLTPSTDEKSTFDSLKVGGVRIHRYARDGSTDEDTEYGKFCFCFVHFCFCRARKRLNSCPIVNVCKLT